MPVYQYQGYRNDGGAATGIIDAENVKVARLKLRKEGVYPTDVVEQGQAPGRSREKTHSRGERSIGRSVTLSVNRPGADDKAVCHAARGRAPIGRSPRRLGGPSREETHQGSPRRYPGTNPRRQGIECRLGDIREGLFSHLCPYGTSRRGQWRAGSDLVSACRVLGKTTRPEEQGHQCDALPPHHARDRVDHPLFSHYLCRPQDYARLRATETSTAHGRPSP